MFSPAIPLAVYMALPTDVLSQKENDLVTGNLADAEDKMAYDSINGERNRTAYRYRYHSLAGKTAGARLLPLTGGDTRTFWLPKELSFHMDSTVIDREAG